MVLILAIPMSASAGTKTIENGTYYIVSKLDESKVLDVKAESKSDQANIQLYDNKKMAHQQFTATFLSNGSYSFTNKNSGKVLDVKGESKSSGANVQQYTNKNGAWQQWDVVSAGGGYFYIISKHSGKYLDVTNSKTANGTNIQVYNGNGTDAQKFKFVSTTDNTPPTSSMTAINVNSAAGTFQIKVNSTAPSGIKRVYLFVWSRADVGDLKTYDAVKQSDGTYLISVNIANHQNNRGTYSVQLNVTAGNGIDICNTPQLKVAMPAPSGAAYTQTVNFSAANSFITGYVDVPVTPGSSPQATFQALAYVNMFGNAANVASTNTAAGFMDVVGTGFNMSTGYFNSFSVYVGGGADASLGGSGGGLLIAPQGPYVGIASGFTQILQSYGSNPVAGIFQLGSQGNGTMRLPIIAPTQTVATYSVPAGVRISSVKFSSYVDLVAIDHFSQAANSNIVYVYLNSGNPAVKSGSLILTGKYA
jgi:hypothetical protein